MNSSSFTGDLTVSLRYLAVGENSAVVRPSIGGGDSASEEGAYETRSVKMRNARSMEPSLDREGFLLANQQTRVTDFFSETEIASIYEKELQSLLTELTGAKRVEIFDHTRRASSIETQRQHGIREPAATIHNDYDDASGPRRLRDFFPQEAKALAKNRFAIINIWRSMNGPVSNFPLALCDASSVTDEDLVSVPRVSKNRVGTVQMATFNPSHRWCYYPHMQMNEALLFKVYDSANDGRARFTPHTSFEDPRVKDATSAGRQSIESRCFVFWSSA